MFSTYTASFLLNNRRVTYARLAVAFCAINYLICSGYAETVSQYGVAFPVGELRSTGAGYTTVEVGNHHELVEDSRVPQFVSQNYFSDRDLFRTVSNDNVFAFIHGALAARDIDGAFVALKALCEFGEASGKEAAALVENISTERDASTLFQKLLTEASLDAVSPRFISVCLATIGMADLEWVRTKAPRLLYTYSDALRIYIREKLLNALHDGRERADSWIDLLKGFFGEDDAEVKSFQILSVKMKQLTEGGKGTEISLSDLSQNDPILKKYLTPLFMETVHKKAEQYVRDRDAQNALVSLSQIEQERRTPTTHALTAQALAIVPGESKILFEHKQVQDFVSKVALKDTSVMEQYLLCLERMFEYRIAQGYLDEAKSVVALVSQVRSDPNTLNDALRIEGALTLLQSGKKAESKQLIDDVQTGVPLIAEAQFLWWKLYLSRVLLGFILLGIVLFATLIKFVPRILGGIRTPHAPHDEEEEEEPEQERPVFVTARSRQSSFSHEYLEDLYDLGLDQSASLKDIKTAYRNRIKDIHPDHQLHKDADEFLKVKAVYERLLEARRKMGLDD